MNFVSVLQKPAVDTQLSRVGQPAFFVLFTRPRIAKVDVYSLDFIVRAKNLVKLLNVVADEGNVLDFSVAEERDDVAPADSEHIELDVNRDEVYIRIEQSHLPDKRALAAADLQHNRVVVMKKILPFSAELLRLGDVKIALGELRLSPFFLSDSH